MKRTGLAGLLLLTALLLTACARGGGGGASPAPAPPPTPTPTPTPTPATASSACQAFRFLSLPGLPLPGLPGSLAERLPGPQVAGGSAPSTEPGREADRFFRSVLGGAEGDCFYEVDLEGRGWGMWAIYRVSGAPDPNGLSEALRQRGAQEVQSTTFTTPMGRLGVVAFRFPLGEGEAMGSLVLVGEGQVIAMAGVEGAPEEGPPTATPTATPQGATQAGPLPTPTPTPTPVPISALPGAVAEADALFRPLLERAMGLTLSPVGYFHADQGPLTMVQISYRPLGEGAPAEGYATALADALKGLGASLVQVSASPMELVVAFGGLPYGMRTANGVVQVPAVGREVQVVLQVGGP